MGVTPEAMPAHRSRGWGSRRYNSASSTTETPEASPTKIPLYQLRDSMLEPRAKPEPAPRINAAIVLTVGWLVATDAIAATAMATAPAITRSSAPAVRFEAIHAAPEAAT